MSFKNAGFFVDAVAPARHPIHKMASPDRTYLYRPTDPKDSIRRAIEESRPDLIIPCDDRVIGHLHTLYSEAVKDGGGRSFSVAKLIETSLGAPEWYSLVRSRRLLGKLSELRDVHIPRTDPIDNLRQLRDWVNENDLPAVLKLDGSWGGRDVILIGDPASILPSFLKMRIRRSMVRRIGAFAKGDVEPLFSDPRLRTRGMSVQAFVPGRVANCSVACWRGEVLASVAVEVIQSRSAFGMATVVRRVEGQTMIAAARSIARHLELSGFVGFDFVLGDDNFANLIEINPRATQITHFSLGGAPDFASVLSSALRGSPIDHGEASNPPSDIALFPQEWMRNPHSSFLESAFHDVPHEEPELIKYYGFDEITRRRVENALPDSSLSL